MNSKIKKVVLTAMFIALSVVGANIKVMGSIALDALPAFLAAMLIGAPYGAIVGVLGHMTSALLAGFPLTLPLHIVIACEMAVICYITGVIAKKGSFMVPVSAAAAFILNGFVSPAILIVWPGMGLPAYLGFLFPLAIASAVNAFVAALIYFPLRKTYLKIMSEK